MNTIGVDIINKTHPAGWRIIGTCPPTVAGSQGLHVTAGKHAAVRDCATDEVIVTGTSLADVLQRLADFTNLTVELTDETNGTTRTFTPAVTR